MVIIGLVVGGVLVGRDLIRAAEINRAIGEIDKYKLAFNTFRLKYNCMPGDCPNATEFLGQNPNCWHANGTGTQTCDGNGDGLVRSGENGMFWSWQQLSATNLIEHNLQGAPGAGGGSDAVLGINTPILIDGVGCSIVSFDGVVWGSGSYFPQPMQNAFYCAGDRPTSWTVDLIEICDILEKMDVKTDDGKPGLGKIRGGKNLCGAGTDPLTSAYNYDESSVGRIFVLLGLFN